MYYYTCYDMASGEDIIVEAENAIDARRKMLNEYGMDVEVYTKVSPERAESSGLDVYS